VNITSQDSQFPIEDSAQDREANDNSGGTLRLSPVAYRELCWQNVELRQFIEMLQAT